jgi:predicted permease
MDAEMRFHLESQIQDYVSRGMDRHAAELRARREFGPIALAKDECRDTARLQWSDLVRDLRIAVRSLRKTPGFAAACIVTLALGIGANTAIFSAVYALLLKPLPFAHPEQLFTVEIQIPQRAEFGRMTGRIQDYLEWRQAHTAFSGVAAATPAEWNLTGTGEPERVGGARVSTNFFSLLGVPVERGRGFLSEEEQPGEESVVVISNGLWRRRFAADPSVIGKTIALDGESHVVVGIAPATLIFPAGKLLYLPFAAHIDVWKPQAPTNFELANENWDQALLLRLRPNQNLETGRQQLESLLNAPAKDAPAGIRLIPRLAPIRDLYAERLRLALILLMGASGVLLLIACSNTASLFLARMASRSTEFATRIALGAGRPRVLAQILTETLLLALAGGLVGTLIAGAGVRILIAFAPSDAGLLAQSVLNVPVLLFALLASLLTGAVCGFLPGWQAFHNDAGLVLQEGVRTALGGRKAVRSRHVLVGVEMALGTALIASAALLLHSFVNVMGAERGYAIDRVLAVDLALSGERYSAGPRRVAFYRQLTENIRALPGVQAAGAISAVLALGDTASQAIFLDTDTDFASLVLKRPVAGFREVTEGYFAASGSALRAGRFFTPQDRVTTAIVSESLSGRLWPREPLGRVIGRKIRQGDPTHAPLVTVVGVVGDARAGAPDQELQPQIYRPYLPPRTDDRMTLVIRTADAPARLAGAVRAEIRKLEPNLPIPAIRTMEEVVISTVAERRFQMILTALFAVVALLLAAVGIYGVVSYAVACRTRDIGLRMALGAVEADILRSVLFGGMRPVWIGLSMGLCGAVAVAHAMRGLLFGIAPTDPVSLGGVAFLLLATAILACYLPARRASRLDPAAALRHE